MPYGAHPRRVRRFPAPLRVSEWRYHGSQPEEVRHQRQMEARRRETLSASSFWILVATTRLGAGSGRPRGAGAGEGAEQIVRRLLDFNEGSGGRWPGRNSPDRRAVELELWGAIKESRAAALAPACQN
jgi:hypothetical protein